MVPTPMMAAVIVWVVETGKPKWVASSITVAALVSAANPWIGSSLITLEPSVCMMRQPPEYVPRAMVSAQATLTQSGIVKLLRWPLETSASVMTPMVFWASLPPCA